MEEKSIEKIIEELIQEYGNEVLRLSYIYLKDKYLAEDAYQEVFIKVYKYWNEFRNESSIKTWIFRITVNVCKDMLKTNWLTKVSFYDIEDIFTQSENNVEQEMKKKELLQQVLTLPDKYKEVIILYYYQGFTTKEIASILDAPIGTIGSLLKRGRELLKDVL